MVKVSFLMSVYNTPIEYLKESIQSMLEQEFRDFEIVIVNDGNSNSEIVEYLSLCERNFSNVLVIHNKKNLGLTKSLNIGLMKCRGKYIARMDADDISKRNRLQLQYDFMEKNKEVAIVGTEVELIGNLKMRVPTYVECFQNYELFKIKMLFNNVGPIHPTIMIRKSFLTCNGLKYRENIKKAQDYALWIDCIQCGGKISIMDIPLLKYRTHGEQITTKEYDVQLMYKKQLICEQWKKIFNMEEEDVAILADFYTNKFNYSIRTYINIIKKVIGINKFKNIFDAYVFEMEIKKRWIHKVIKCILKKGDWKGLCCLYTWKCLFSKAGINWIKENFY